MVSDARAVRLRPLVLAAVVVALLGALLTPAAAQGRFEAQVMNGEPALIEDLPSVVYVETSDASCTGTLIAPTWVLTAGHCFTTTNVTGVSAGIGSDVFGSFPEVIAAKRIVVHPNFDGDSLQGDLALIELVSPSSATVQELADVGAADPVGAIATITGWGMLDLELYPDDLQRADIPVLDDSACSTLYGTGYDGATFVCAGGTGSDVCPGDSGGPLLVTQDGVLTQVGIVSYGEDCTPVSKTTGAYTAVASYRDWIDGYAGTAEPEPEPEPEPEGSFSDVPADGTHAANIEKLVAAGVTQGYPDGTFRPALTVSRAQMATFLAKALGIDLSTVDTSDTGFPDVPSSHAHAAGIVAVAERGITGGYSDGTFRPGAPVSRAQMATFLAKALDVDLATVDTSDTGFPDVASDFPHAPGIVAVADRAITGGYSDGTFRPAISVSRAQMASFLVAAFQLGE